MKKTLLATAIAGAIAASGMAVTNAQAATVYDQDGTRLDVYGRIVYGITSGGTQEEVGVKSTGSEFEDLGSRFGFRMNHQVTSDMSVYARLEFRGRADANNRDGFDNVRNTYVGVKSNTWGDVMVGNFDSVYYRSGDVLFDVPEGDGWAHLGGISQGSRGDAISYSTPTLEGFRAHVQAKHLSGNGAEEGAGDNSSTWTTAAAVDYTIDRLYVSVGYNQAKDVADRGAKYDGGSGNPAGEDLVGIFASYQFTPAFSGRIKYEEVTDTFSQARLIENGAYDAIESIFGIGGTFDYGAGEIYGDYYNISMAWDGASSRDQWVLGANYRFSKPMYVFAEVVEFDTSYSDQVFDGVGNVSELDDDLLYTVGVRYDF